MQKVLFLVLIALVVLRVGTLKYDYPEGKRVRIKTQLVTEPITYESQRLIKFDGLRAYVPLLPEVSYGDVITVEGTIESGRLQDVVVVRIQEAGGLFGLRERILSIYKRTLPEPHASLVSGIVLGSQEDMPASYWKKLKTTGTAHVVVASGMNVTFVISFLLGVLVNFTKRGKAVLLASAGAWVYVFLSGFDAPLVRAAIMGTIAFSAQSMGRLSSAIRALFFSAAFMLIAFPAWAYDLGFILSLVATLSLILFESKISTLLSRAPLIIKKDFATSLAAQIGVAPILFLTFGSFNVLSPFINALVLWTVPPIMIFGAIAAFVGIIYAPLGGFLSYLSFPFTFWFVKVIELSSGSTL